MIGVGVWTILTQEAVTGVGVRRQIGGKLPQAKLKTSSSAQRMQL
jgi:hypothetical protein